MVRAAQPWAPETKLLDLHTQIHNTTAHFQKIPIDEGSFKAYVELHFL